MRVGADDPVPEEEPTAILARADALADEGEYAAALALRERAFVALRGSGEVRRAAVLAAYQIAFDHLALFGHGAVARGWLQRGTELIRGQSECAEVGWVLLARALHSADRTERAELVASAAEVADRWGDADLWFDALAYTGLGRVEEGDVAAGTRLLDEAAAAARAGEVSSGTVAGEIYCKMMMACETVLDVTRAEEWREQAEPMAGRPALRWATAICRTHHGGVLVAAGRWVEAEILLQGALQLYEVSYVALRRAALVRLAELRVRQGRALEAEQLLSGQEQDPAALRPWARARWARSSDPASRAWVARVVEQRLREQEPLAANDVLTLALVAQLDAALGRPEAARRAVHRLRAVAERDVGRALRGYANHADGVVTGSLDRLEAAVAAFGATRLPLEEAVARLEIARLLRVVEPVRAAGEAQAAVTVLAGLGAHPHRDEAEALLRELGGPRRTGPRHASGQLTDRETEVLALVAEGLSNPEIAARLFISRKTVAHHVSNAIAKLGVRNRAEAAAWAVRNGLSATR
ncbi:helix-turn-helix transcriptional regulator [Ornithinicoccus halotolerans]|uniref:helix-turn-helix transcriptional regulator n=1 Tax=Ornithinicoccus halotolerans TaxID=1748220 RepID=UPI002B212F42|nr:LuxR C-terminal-related transcriptional regulator [Ornithinicoccus halotolerans]